MKKKILITIGLLVLFAVCSLTAMSLLRRNQGTVTVINVSSLSLDKVNILICNQRFELSKIKPGEKQRINFKVTSDSHYEVSVQFVSGKKMKQNVGYITNGINYEDNLIIKDNEIIIEQESR